MVLSTARCTFFVQALCGCFLPSSCLHCPVQMSAQTPPDVCTDPCICLHRPICADGRCGGPCSACTGADICREACTLSPNSHRDCAASCTIFCADTGQLFSQRKSTQYSSPSKHERRGCGDMPHHSTIKPNRSTNSTGALGVYRRFPPPLRFKVV